MNALNPDSYEYHHEYLEVLNKYNKELQRLLQELLVLESGKSPRI